MITPITASGAARQTRASCPLEASMLIRRLLALLVCFTAIAPAPARAVSFMKVEMDKWTKVAKFANIKLG
jgi:hypothetical protein